MINKLITVNEQEGMSDLSHEVLIVKGGNTLKAINTSDNPIPVIYDARDSGDYTFTFNSSFTFEGKTCLTTTSFTENIIVLRYPFTTNSNEQSELSLDIDIDYDGVFTVTDIGLTNASLSILKVSGGASGSIVSQNCSSSGVADQTISVQVGDRVIVRAGVDCLTSNAKYWTLTLNTQ